MQHDLAVRATCLAVDADVPADSGRAVNDDAMNGSKALGVAMMFCDSVVPSMTRLAGNPPPSPRKVVCPPGIAVGTDDPQAGAGVDMGVARFAERAVDCD